MVIISIESAKAFFEFLKTDQDLDKKMTAALTEERSQEIIRSAGDFEISREEWLTVLNQAAGRELSDDELEDVAGGAWPTPYAPDFSDPLDNGFY